MLKCQNPHLPVRTGDKCGSTWLEWRISSMSHDFPFIELIIHKFKRENDEMSEICVNNMGYRSLSPWKGYTYDYLFKLILTSTGRLSNFVSCGFGSPKRLILHNPVVLKLESRLRQREKLIYTNFSIVFSYRRILYNYTEQYGNNNNNNNNTTTTTTTTTTTNNNNNYYYY